MLLFLRILRRQVQELFEQEEKMSEANEGNAFVTGGRHTTGVEMPLASDQVERGGGQEGVSREAAPADDEHPSGDGEDGEWEDAHEQQGSSASSAETETSEDRPPLKRRRTSNGVLCCIRPGCKKQAVFKGLCVAHGGRRSCSSSGCGKAAVSKGKCFEHGGGKRCFKRKCSKRAYVGNFYSTHGGGDQSSHPGCTKRERYKHKCGGHYRSESHF